jgi:plasmid replication initiation protein
MTSKYAIALYEIVQLRTNMDRCVEAFALERFRDLLGAPPGAYVRGNDFARSVIQRALLEVNGLSDVGVDLALKRRGKFTPIEAVTVTWWKKEGDEYRAAVKERDKSKIGRMARLKGAVEIASPLPSPG